MPLAGCTMVIFGGSGDLARRKLVPALFNLSLEKKLPENFSLLGIGRRQKSSEQYRNELAAAVTDFSFETWDQEAWNHLQPRIDYLSVDIEDPAAYPLIRAALNTGHLQRGQPLNELYYLAVAPQLFLPIAANLADQARPELAGEGTGWRRIMIEKPFGHDLESAARLNQVICSAFHDREVYRTDHYLGKEMLHNIMIIRFINTVFEPLWNCDYIDNVQITVAENEGIGFRGSYYDRSGAMRDMIQSHLLQMLAVVAMEPPGDAALETVIREKIELLKAVKPWSGEGSAPFAIFGQYDGYRQEKDVDAASMTETFAAVKLAVERPRWRGVPFYLRSGKMLADKQARVTVQFKKAAAKQVAALGSEMRFDSADLVNLLILKVQPSEGLAFQFNIKEPASAGQVVPATMDFCQQCAYQINSPEAYELLIADAIRGEKGRFSSWEEIEQAWRLVDAIYERLRLTGPVPLSYRRGSWGPEQSGALLAMEGRSWWF